MSRCFLCKCHLNFASNLKVAYLTCSIPPAITRPKMKLSKLVIGAISASTIFECTYAYPGTSSTIREIEEKIQQRQYRPGFRRLPKRQPAKVADPNKLDNPNAADPVETADPNAPADPNEAEDPNEVEDPIRGPQRS